MNLYRVNGVWTLSSYCGNVLASGTYTEVRRKLLELRG